MLPFRAPIRRTFRSVRVLTLAPLAALVLAALAQGPAVAAPPTGTPAADANLQKAVPARFVMGVKFGGGGTLWDSPDNTKIGVDEQGAGFDMPIFNETRAGYTISSGFFLQGVFFDHLGLEVGMHFVQHTLLEEVKWTYTELTTINGNQNLRTFEAKSEEELSWTALHVPILVKAVIPAGKTRVSLGVGPEFAFSSWSRTKYKITEGGLSSANPSDNAFPRANCYDGKTRLPGTRCDFEAVKAKDQDSIYLAVVFGIEIVAGDFIIPIDLHWSYNFSQEKDYLQRVAIDPDTIPQPGNASVRPTELTLNTRDSMYGGIRIGIAYQF